MKSYSTLLLLALFLLSSFTSKTAYERNSEILLSIKKISEGQSVNMLFFTDGSCSVQQLENGKQTSSKSMVMPEAEFKSLKKLISKVRPIELKSKYTCMEKKVNKTNATVYSFGESKKVVVINNSCQTVRRLEELRSFTTRFLQDNL